MDDERRQEIRDEWARDAAADDERPDDDGEAVRDVLRIMLRQIKERDEKIAELETELRDRDTKIFTLQAMIERAHA